MNQNEHTTLHIALGADNRYAEQVQTLMKSVCCHNRNICFYLLNRDFPAEWFNFINQKLAVFGSSVEDIKIDNRQISGYKTLDHIGSESTYFRYFIPQTIPASRVLYLDCDLVVNGSLGTLFNVDLHGYPLAAVADIIAKAKMPEADLQFNAGVMLIDNEQWQNANLTEQALQLSDRLVQEVPDGDQSILNILFAGKWLPLHRNCNYQIGCDVILPRFGREDLLENLGDIVPLIVHYNSLVKPWLNVIPTRFRDLYWHYRNLEWSEISRGPQ